MEGCLADLGKTFVEKLIDKALAELRHVFCFTCIANEFKEEKVWLKSEIETLEQRAKVAAGNDKDIKANYRLWKEKADKLIQEDIKTKQTCFFGLCPNCIWRYKKGKELANYTQEIKRLLAEKEKFENIELYRSLPDAERHSFKDYVFFESRESKYKELLDALKDDNNYIVVLQGMGGIGKTTLAKKVVKEIKESAQFTYVIDTTVSFTPDIKKIQDDIAGPLGLKLEDCNDSDRSKRLWSRLTNGKDGEKVLLILDDVWDQHPPFDFDLIGIPKQDNHKGRRVLITTRSKQIFYKMKCDRMIELELLSEEEAWTMFKTYAGKFSKNLIPKGREIAKECKQLPVAIEVIASSLRGQQDRKHEWDATLKSLKKPVSMDNVDDEMVGIYNCLKVSYDYMKNEQAKGLFLLSSIFPEDKVIPIEILTRLGIGRGLFGEDNGQYDDARTEVVVAKNRLIDNCLLIEVGKEHVKMHDLVREVAQWIANKEIQCVNLSNKDKKSSLERKRNIKYLFCKGKDIDLFSCKYDGSKLEILIVDMEREKDRRIMEVPSSFFENIVKLRVLYLLGDYNQTISLPHSIHSLENIRCILVVGIDLDDISVLGNLQSLETLDLVGCIIDELPYGIAKLGKLKLLNLKRCKIRRNDPFEVIERCSTLEELYFINSFNDFCRKLTLPKLQRYHICKGLEKINDSLSKYVYFGADDVSFFSKETFQYLMQTAEGLQLYEIKKGWRNLMPEIVPVDLGMKDLVELRLRHISQLQCLIDTTGSQVPIVLSKLKKLYLHKMENLEQLFKGSLSFDSLKNLEKLSIRQCERFQRLFNCNQNLCNLRTMTLWDCPMLVNLFPLFTSRSPMLLEKLSIYDCEGLENIVIDDGDNDDKSHGPMFPKLRDLSVGGCHRLESIFPFLSFEDFPVLEVIIISSCDKLKDIFGQYKHVELSSLKEIRYVDLSELPNFMGIFPEYSHFMSSHVSESSSTSRHGLEAQTQVETIKCNIFSWRCICCHGNNYKHKPGSMSTTKIRSVHEDPPQNIPTTSVLSSHPLQIWKRTHCLAVQSHIMCNIKEITLSGLSKIKSVFMLSITSRMLVETLRIEKCDELKYIIVDIGDDDSGGNNWDNVFPNLNRLEVYNCKELEYIFGNYSDDYQNHTKIHLHLPTLRKLELKSLLSFFAMCPRQYCLTFPSLKELEILECSHNAIKYMGEFIILSDSYSVSDKRITKELSGSIEQPINLRSQKIELHDLQYTMCLLLVPNNSFSLQDLTRITIVRCEILEIVFSTSILRCLPQLVSLKIEECKELKHIIKDDRQNKNLSPRTFFPKLEALFVIKCHKLKSVFPVSICKELPELKALWISEADELEEIFNSEGDQKVKTPNINMVVLIKLRSLFPAQGIQLQTAGNRFVQDCGKLSLTNLVYIPFYRFDFREVNTDYYTLEMCSELFRKLSHGVIGHDTGNENPSAETIEDVCVGATSGYKFTSSQEMEKEQTESQQDILGENNTTVKPSQGVEEGITLTNTQIITIELASSTEVSELEKEKSTSQQCLINEQDLLGEINTTVKPYQGVEEEIALTHVHTTHLELANSSQELEKEQPTSQQDLINQQDLFGEVNITF